MEPLPVRDRHEIDIFLDLRSSAAGWSAHTRAAYRRDLDLYAAHLESLAVESWARSTLDTVVGFLATLSAAGEAERTIARRVACLRSFHRHLLEEGILAADVLAALPPAKRALELPHFLTRDEIEALLVAPQGVGPLALRDRAIIELLYATGVRASELVSVREIDLVRGERRVHAVKVLGKGQKERYVPLHARASEKLDDYLRRGRPRLVSAHGSPALFLKKSGRPLTRMDLYVRLRRLGVQAGIRTRVTPHLLRHTFATHLVHHGADLRAVQEMLGHADLATTTIYTSVDTRRLKDIHCKHHPRA
jgi:integrase/recombinase XerD